MQTKLESAKTASGSSINTGAQTVPLNQVQTFVSANADVSVVKNDIPDPVIQGQTLNYTLLVKNNSPDTVANGINVTDTLDANTTLVSATCAPYTQTGNTLIFNVGFLSPSQSVTLTISTMVSNTAWANNDTTTNPEQGSATPPAISYDLLNRVSETAITSDSNTGNNTYYQPTNVLEAFKPSASLTLLKQISTSSTGPWSDSITVPGGSPVYYNFTVINTGNVPLSSISINDPIMDTSGITWPEPLDKLASASGVVGPVTAETLAGTYKNTATASGTYDGKVYESGPDTAEYIVAGAPALSITKTADPMIYNAVDQTITYTYVVTNTGNVPVSDIAVVDDKATVTIDSSTLAPTASVTGTATYKITQDDLNAGSVTNIAYATGTFNQIPVKSNEASVTVKKITSTGQIAPTGTTCDQYMSGTAADLTQAAYLVDSKAKAIKSVSPGVMFYYSTITVPAGGPSPTTISVTQSKDNNTWLFIAIQGTKQVILYSSSCSKIAGTTVTNNGSTVTLKVNNLPAGTYYLGIKYSLSSLQGFKPIVPPYPTVKYTFKTSLNGNVISTSEDSIDLISKK